MSTTEARPAISDKFEALKMEKTVEAMAQKSGGAGDQSTSLQCCNSTDTMLPCQLYDEH